MRNVARALGFTALSAAVSFAWLRYLCSVLPPLRDEPSFSLVVAPLTALAGLASLAVHPVLLGQRSGVARALTFALAFAGACVAYSLALAARFGAPNAVFLGLLASAFYGPPLLLALLALHKLAGRWLCPRPAALA